MSKRKPKYNPHQSKISVQDVRDYSTKDGASQANEEMRRIQLEIERLSKEKEAITPKEDKSLPRTTPAERVAEDDGKTKLPPPEEEKLPSWALTILHNNNLVRQEKNVQVINFNDSDNLIYNVTNIPIKQFTTLEFGRQVNITPTISQEGINIITKENNVVRHKTYFKPRYRCLRNSGKYTTGYDVAIESVLDSNADYWTLYPMDFITGEHSADFVYRKSNTTNGDSTQRFIFRCQAPGTYAFSVNCEVEMLWSEGNTSAQYSPCMFGMWISINESLSPGDTFATETGVLHYFKQGEYQRIAQHPWIPEIPSGGLTADNWETRKIIPLKGTVLWDLDCGDEVEFYRAKFYKNTNEHEYKIYGTLNIERVREDGFML